MIPEVLSDKHCTARCDKTSIHTKVRRRPKRSWGFEIPLFIMISHQNPLLETYVATEAKTASPNCINCSRYCSIKQNSAFQPVAVSSVHCSYLKKHITPQLLNFVFLACLHFGQRIQKWRKVLMNLNIDTGLNCLISWGK